MSLAVTPLAEAVVTSPDRPLVVDLDGTLIRSDCLIESFFSIVGENPLRAIRTVFSLRSGKAALKASIAGICKLDVSELPLNEQVLDFINAERARGRRVYLASAADQVFVAALARKLGVFDGVFASDGQTNLSGRAKAAALCDAFGEGGFDYAGNDAIDMAVWEKAHQVLVADAPPALLRRVVERWPNARILSKRQLRVRAYLKAIRLHQWAKNVLLFVPALAAHQWGLADLATCLLAFLSFGLCASSVYVTNDLIDLSRDRAHTTKRHRPFAAGTIPLVHGLAMIPALFAASVFCGLLVGWRFLLVLGAYYAGALAYSLVLKRFLLLDVVTLAGLYGLRLYAGAVAVGVQLAAWLGTFALFIFACLALIKRCTELIERSEAGLGNPSGRNYRTGDLPVLMSMAAAAGFTAVLVVALYALRR